MKGPDCDSNYSLESDRLPPRSLAADKSQPTSSWISPEKQHCPTNKAGRDRPRLTAQQAIWVEAHLALVKRAALRVSHAAGEDLLRCDELEAEGYRALVEVALRYDPDHPRGASFATFVTYRVRGAMIDALRRLSPGKRLRDRFGFQERSGSVPLIQRVPGYDTRSDRRLIDALTPSVEQQLHGQQLELQLRTAALKLSAEDQRLLHGLYVQQKTMRSLADELDVSTATICRRHARILKRLRRLLSSTISDCDLQPFYDQPHCP